MTSKDAEGAQEDARYRVQALARGLSILALFTENRPSMALKEIADVAALPLPTAFRLVSTLVGEGFLERLPSGDYQPGKAVLTLGFAALQSDDLLRSSTTSMQALAAATGETVNLGTLSGDRVLYLARIRTQATLVTANLHVGSTLPAVYASMGKVLLAHLDPDECQRLLAGVPFGEPGWGPNAIKSAAALRRQLEQVRSDGFAIQDQEIAAGLRSIAAPLWDASGRVVAAVNIAVAASAFGVSGLQEDLREPLLTCCEHISRRLGAPPGSSPSSPSKG